MSAKLILTGRLATDVEVRELKNGHKVANFRLACKEYNRTEFVACTVWGPAADYCGNYLNKGDVCNVDGNLKTESWEKDGVKHYKTVCESRSVEGFPRKKEDAGDEGIPF